MLEIPPETIATVVESTAAIGAITIGSNQIAKKPTFGSALLLVGALGMTHVAFGGGDLRYILPEILICSGSALSLAENVFTDFQKKWSKVRNETRLALFGAISTGIMGILQVHDSFSTASDFLAPAGLLALATAFALNPKQKRANGESHESLFRKLSISGAVALVLGSGIDVQQAASLDQALVPAAFLALNALYLGSEVVASRNKA